MSSTSSSLAQIVQQAKADAESLQKQAFATKENNPDPQIVGYQVGPMISRGGQSIVFSAVRISDNTAVAIKLLRTGHAASSTEINRFSREVETLQRLDHPGIVRVFDSGICDAQLYLVMELLVGQTLIEFVEQQQPNSTQRIKLFLQVVDAVNAAHQRGVIHRDLKPANVIVNADGQVHLIDFGLAGAIDRVASAEDSLTKTGLVIGSLPWASPEHAAGDSNKIDTRSDVYSLGVLLYQILTGTFPYSVEGGPLEVLQRIQTETPDSLRDIDPAIDRDLETIALTCLSKEPNQRYQSAADLKEDLQRWLVGDAISARRESTLKKFRHAIRRHRWITALAIICAIVGFGFGAMMMVARQATQQQANAADRQNAMLRQQIAKMTSSAGKSQNWVVAFDNAETLKNLPSGKAFDAMQQTWDKLESVNSKQQFLKSIAYAKSPDTHRGLHLGMLDESPQVKSWACTFLSSIALFDTAAHHERYLAWYEKYKAVSAGQAMLGSLRELEADTEAAIKVHDYVTAATRLASVDEIRGQFDLFSEDEELANQVKVMKLVPLAFVILKQDAVEQETKDNVAGLLEKLPVDEAFAKNQIVPLLPSVKGGVLRSLIGSVGRQSGDWSKVALMNEMRRQMSAGVDLYMSGIASALASQDDSAAIPLMIAAIDADNTYNTIYGVGYFGLEKLTGVKYDESHNGTWWRKWWSENKDSYKLSEEAKQIPVVESAKRT